MPEEEEALLSMLPRALLATSAASALFADLFELLPEALLAASDLFELIPEAFIAASALIAWLLEAFSVLLGLQECLLKILLVL